MVQIIDQNKPSFGSSLLGGLSETLPDALSQFLSRKRQGKERTAESSALEESGYNVPSGIVNPKIREALLQQQQNTKLTESASQKDQQTTAAIEKAFGKEAADLYPYLTEGGKTYYTKSLLEDAVRGRDLRESLGNFIQSHPEAIKGSQEEISSQSMQQPSAPSTTNANPATNPTKTVGRTPKEIVGEEQKLQEFQRHQGAEKEKSLRAENLPIRKELSDKAASARRGIENKERLLDLIKSGEINDPTYATLAEAVPLNLGKRLLSPATVEYKAGLIDEFTDLRKIFQGQTRVKEIELLEKKIADLYLTDEQKETILKSRINALKSDIIREEAASELEEGGKQYGVLQFGREVEKRAKPKLDALFNKILDEQKAVIQNAENRKKIPLDPNDPDDAQIAKQLLQEANGDRQKARALAKKKGYKF